MQNPECAGTTEYPNLPECDNGSVRSISRDNIDAAWLAGIVDGEGCLSVLSTIKKRPNAPYRALRVEIRNTDPYLIERVTRILAEWEIHFTLQFQKMSGYRERYRDCLIVLVQQGNAIYRLLCRLVDQLTGAKQEQAKAMLEFLEWRNTQYAEGKRYRGRSLLRDEEREELFQRREALYKTLRAIKARRWSFQRLPRGASQRLELDKLDVLEAVVESGLLGD